MLKTVFNNQSQLILEVVNFYCNGVLDLDPTYSKGNFYKGISISPKHKFDLSPQFDDVIKADFANLPIESKSINSIMFDPPFITEGGSNSIIRKRFSSYNSIQDLIGSYTKALSEFYRILAKKGVLIFKCQDTTYWHKNYFIHCVVHNQAIQLGFKAQDLFILEAKNRITAPAKNQEHARKFHSYFWVFVK